MLVILCEFFLFPVSPGFDCENLMYCATYSMGHKPKMFIFLASKVWKHGFAENVYTIGIFPARFKSDRITAIFLTVFPQFKMAAVAILNSETKLFSLIG